MWASISKANQICDLAKGWTIGNGRTISLWTDRWLNSTTLRSCISGLLHRHEASLTLHELWDTQGHWCLDHLSFTIPPNLSAIIKATPKPLTHEREDSVLWHPTSNGLFSTHSAYSLTHDLYYPRTVSKGWGWIWKINTLPRISSFIWLACHDRLIGLQNVIL